MVIPLGQSPDLVISQLNELDESINTVPRKIIYERQRSTYELRMLDIWPRLHKTLRDMLFDG